MSSLHLVRLPVDLRALTTFAITQGVADDDDGYAIHLALRRRFGAAAPQPFRLFAAGVASPHLLGYVSDIPALLDAASLPPTDDAPAAVFPSIPAAKPMPAQWRVGARFDFDVRVRPVIRYGRSVRERRRADGKHGAAERDAFLAAVERAEGQPVDRAAVYADWLARQLTGAADVKRCSLAAMRRLTTRRSPHGRPGQKRIEGYETVFTGTLCVADAARFGCMLRHGVGRHAAFGFGMLILAPPRDPSGAD